MAKTILVVDDSASMRQIIRMALKGVGYEVVEANDGKDALQKLDGSKFHLIISDVNMPNMDGLSFVKAAKLLPTYKFTPVIMLITEAGETMKQQGKAIGVKAWVVKPFQPPQFLAAVSQLILP